MPEAAEAFIQLAAHELRTPLTVLLGMLQLILAKQEITDRDCRPLAESALTEARRIQTIVDDLTEVTRLRIGELSLDRQTADLNDLAVQATEGLQGPLTAQPLRITRHHEPLPVSADGVRLRRAIQHAMSHVAERAPSQTGVHMRTSLDPGWAHLLIEGYGATLHRPPTASLVRDHREPALGSSAYLGLRLYLAEQMALLHGGQLHIQTEPESTLRVRFSLPLVNGPEG
ncbi:MAG TPA: HAMP domain-containing sensor histidine kinase [Chloroflexota bacterium]|nr:HAMP domain-containing sensor histidine kinase [Chloroflexota bacterium]